MTIKKDTMKKSDSKSASKISLKAEVKSESTTKTAKKELVKSIQKKEPGKASSSTVPKTTTKQFSRDDLLRYKLAESQYVNARMLVQLKANEIDQLKASWEAKGKQLVTEYQNSQAQFSQQENMLIALRSELASKYEIKFDRISFNDQTGVIHELPSS